MNIKKGFTIITEKGDPLVIAKASKVYGIIDNTDKILKDQTSFYFKKSFAKGVASELNHHMSETLKPFKVKEFYLIELNKN